MSQALRALGRELGVQLFHRIGRGMVLSAAGRTMVGPARQIVRDMDAAQHFYEHVLGTAADVVAGRDEAVDGDPGLAAVGVSPGDDGVGAQRIGAEHHAEGRGPAAQFADQHLSARGLRGQQQATEWNEARATARIPGGESMMQVQARAVAELVRLRDNHPGARIALVSHADVIKSVLIAGLHQHATNLCVEVGRQAAPEHLRPSFTEVESALREMKKAA